MRKNCTIYKTASFIGKRWTLLIILEIYKGDKDWIRYSALKNRLMDITPKILSARLKELEKENLIKRRVDTKNFPIKSEYTLTEMGKEFIKVIEKMKDWALKYKIDNQECEIKTCKECGF